MNRIKKICLGIGLLCSSSVFATALDGLSAQLEAIKTLSATFTQHVFNLSGRMLNESSGNMMIERPGKFYWHVQTPQEQLLIVTDTHAMYYQPDLQQVILRSVSNDVGETPAAFLLNSSKNLLDKNYRISGSDEDYVLTPKNQKNLVQSVELLFKGAELSHIIVQDHLDHRTVIDLTNVKMNQPLDESFFKFSPPEGVDVVRE